MRYILSQKDSKILYQIKLNLKIKYFKTLFYNIEIKTHWFQSCSFRGQQSLCS